MKHPLERDTVCPGAITEVVTCTAKGIENQRRVNLCCGIDLFDRVDDFVSREPVRRFALRACRAERVRQGSVIAVDFAGGGGYFYFPFSIILLIFEFYDIAGDVWTEGIERTNIIFEHT